MATNGRSAPIYEHNSTVSFKLPEALDAGVFDRLLSDDLSQLTTYFRRVSGSNTDALFSNFRYFKEMDQYELDFDFKIKIPRNNRNEVSKYNVYDWRYIIREIKNASALFMSVFFGTYFTSLNDRNEWYLVDRDSISSKDWWFELFTLATGFSLAVILGLREDDSRNSRQIQVSWNFRQPR